MSTSKSISETLSRAFSADEPCFDNHDINGTSILELGRAGTYYPWNDCLTGMLKAELGEDAAQYLPFLWQKSANHIEAKIRTAYMNCITRLYQKNFSETLGDWCQGTRCTVYRSCH